MGAEMPVVVVALCRICNRGEEPTLQHTDICVFISNRQNCGCEKYSRELGILQGRRSAGAKKSDRGTDADAMRCLPVRVTYGQSFPRINVRPSVRPSALAGLKVEILRNFSGRKRFCHSSFSRVRRRAASAIVGCRYFLFGVGLWIFYFTLSGSIHSN